MDPEDFAWTDGAWRGVPRERLVIYEMHIGTFTPEGSWDAALRELAALAELGITCLEIMPVAEFFGPIRLGIRRRRSFRAHPSLRRAG
jgi:maltooligosyltrehalose trehalohydrolase